MGALDLVMGIGKGALGAVKKTAPFFSKADVVLDELQRGKGTGNEFLTELVKKGAKPTELKERGIERALKDRPKMTKAEVQKVFEEKASPKVQEKVLTSDAPDYDEFLDAKAQEIYGADWFDLSKQERRALDKMYSDLPLTQYDKYKTPGGENYREILLKLPAKSERDIADEKLRAFTDRVTQRLGRSGWDFESMTPEELIEYEHLNNAAMKASMSPSNVFASSHWNGEPNVLAHIRVQDFKTPEGKKVLLVDEIQSDWHQEGRKKGYKGEFANKTEQEFKTYAKELASKYDLNPDQNLAMYATMKRMQPEEVAKYEQLQSDWVNSNRGVPDAPFKKNWHELAMKRVLDYAAENGYDTVAITPGAEQAKRYDLSKQLNEINYGKNPDGTYSLTAVDKNGRVALNEPSMSQQQLESMVGKDLTQKIVSGEGNDFPAGSVSEGKKSLSGLDLQVGGEGMKGFYDKILPDYLNTFGKQYGSGVGEIDLITKPEKSVPQIAAPGLGHFPEPIIEPAQTMKAWSFDITPQLREQIKTKGLPLYSKTGMGPEGLAAGTGAATIGAEALTGEDEQQVQNPVHFTENPDAMQLELMQRN